MTTEITVRPLSERTAFQAAQEARRRNETSYETTVSVMELPSAHVAWKATPTTVQVTATDIDVLAEWLYVRRGTITKTDLPSGQTVWTLHTTTWSDSPKFPPVPVHVSVVLPADEPVMHEIAAAVAA
ncbi:hypothetical protein [Streptomyces purpurascens]|uniref:hypothetical protein n=1 Tax=Streptomyces purpurascens TaxID=1924 RepID=UPI001679686D|nr:hypothetical protein [Streptomyces purpurascens]MCE7049504.1 hypothetical protein [Streptomyces purpurascens]GHA22160.1 hypothetical protein GCM10010303_35830 [Streptomyces purpurascens]